MLINSPVLHIYEQYAHHDDIIIVGNNKGLKNLHEAIGRLINEEKSSVEISEGMVNDGEHYQIIILKENSDTKLEQLVLPYTADYAVDQRTSYVTPHDIINIDEYNEKTDKVGRID